MENNKNIDYLCVNKTSWKLIIIVITFITILFSLILFLPRSGNNEKNAAFYILLAFGLGIDLFLIYAGLLRKWAKVYIQDGIIYSKTAYQGFIPLSGQMPLNSVQEIFFIYNARLDRKKTAYPNSKKMKELKAQIAEKIDEIIQSRHIKNYNFSDDKYNFPASCGSLILKDNNNKKLRVNLQMIFYIADIQEVRKFLSFLPKDIKYTWRYGTVYIDNYSIPF